MKLRLLYTLMALVAITACKKLNFDKEKKGESIADFTLSAPSNNSNILLNASTPNDQVVMSWSAAKAGVGAAVKYTWIAALKTGSLESPIISIMADNAGSSTQLTLTQKQLDDALKAAGIAAGAKAD